MGSNAVSGKTAVLQTTIEYYPEPPSTWDTIAEVTRIGDLNFERDVTHVYSNDPFFQEATARVGLFKPVIFNFDVNIFNSSGIEYETLSNIRDSVPREYWYRIKWPEMAGEEEPSMPIFAGVLVGMNVTTPLEGLLKASITIAVSGTAGLSQPPP